MLSCLQWQLIAKTKLKFCSSSNPFFLKKKPDNEIWNERDNYLALKHDSYGTLSLDGHAIRQCPDRWLAGAFKLHPTATTQTLAAPDWMNTVTCGLLLNFKPDQDCRSFGKSLLYYKIIHQNVFLKTSEAKIKAVHLWISLYLKLTTYLLVLFFWFCRHLQSQQQLRDSNREMTILCKQDYSQKAGK